MKKTYYDILVRRNGDASYLRTEKTNGMIVLELDWGRDVYYLAKRNPSVVELRTSLMDLGVWDVRKQNRVINDLIG